LTINQSQVECLAETLYHEARGEPREGRAAVAMVVLNRASDLKRWRDTICEVVRQPGQFEWYDENHVKPRYERETWMAMEDESQEYILKYILGVPFVPEELKEATFFSVGGFKNPKRIFIARVGGHRFFKTE